MRSGRSRLRRAAAPRGGPSKADLRRGAVRPRPALLFSLCYGAGLATGLLRFGNPLAAIVPLGVALATRRPLPMLLAAAATLGRACGERARLAHASRSAARVPPAARSRLVVRLAEPVRSDGGRVLVEPLGARCRGEVFARWPPGTASAAGLESRVEATWIPRRGPAGRADGTLVVHGADAPTG